MYVASYLFISLLGPLPGWREEFQSLAAMSGVPLVCVAALLMLTRLFIHLFISFLFVLLFPVNVVFLIFFHFLCVYMCVCMHSSVCVCVLHYRISFYTRLDVFFAFLLLMFTHGQEELIGRKADEVISWVKHQQLTTSGQKPI